MPNSGEVEVVKQIHLIKKWLRRLESMIIRPTGSGTLHNAVTVTDTATINLTLTGQNIQADLLGGGSGHTIEDEGVPLTARTGLNFIGAGVTATDNAGTDATDVTIPGGVAVANIGSTAETVGGAVADGVAATASRSDHKHAITNPKLDDLATPDANTDLNANTTNHGLLLQATAPAAGLMNFVGITSGETAYLNKPLFDTVNPAANGVADPGTQVIAARRDHVHVLNHASGGDTALGAVGTKDPAIDADKVLYRDSASADVLVTSTWTQIKAFLKTYFDTIYAALAHTARHAVGGADSVFPADPNADRYLMWDDVPGELVWSSPAGAGDVVGPAGASDGNLAVFDGATGKLIKDGGAPGGGSTDVLMVQVFT